MRAPAKTVSEAINSRISVRAFSNRPVDPALVRRLLDAARQSPSGGNVQPWHLTVLGGEPLAQLKAQMLARAPQGLRSPQGQGYDVYPRDLKEPYAARRGKCGEDMYATMGIERADKPARIAWVLRNYQFWDAPVGIFVSIDRSMGPPQWSDLGMYVQTFMLLAREAGLDTCPQECWTNWSTEVSGFIGLPENMLLFCGIALGYADESHPVNTLRTERAPLGEIATFVGI